MEKKDKMKINAWKVNMRMGFFCGLILTLITVLNYNSTGVLISAILSLLFMLFGLGACIMVKLQEIEYAITQTKV
jgi:hypothetical protein